MKELLYVCISYALKGNQLNKFVFSVIIYEEFHPKYSKIQNRCLENGMKLASICVLFFLTLIRRFCQFV